MYKFEEFVNEKMRVENLFNPVTLSFKKVLVNPSQMILDKMREEFESVRNEGKDEVFMEDGWTVAVLFLDPDHEYYGDLAYDQDHHIAYELGRAAELS